MKVSVIYFACLFILFSGLLSAQNCVEEALQGGKEFYEKGEYAQALAAWKKGMKCPGAKKSELSYWIRMVEDDDKDGVVNAKDFCPYELGSQAHNGCSCYKTVRRDGIDAFYDKDYQTASGKWEEASQCADKPAESDLESWVEKTQQRQLEEVPPTSDQAKEAGVIVEKVVDEQPEFPGGDEKMLEFIYYNVHYPALARENGVEGMVVIKFIVEPDGYITHSEILRDIGGGCGMESLRVVDEMPLWNPGKMNGKPVRVQFNLPVKFKLE